MVKDIYPGSAPMATTITYDAVALNNHLLFSANNGTEGYELWISDGTAQGTEMIKDINIFGSSMMSNLIEVNGIVFFGASDGINGFELWKSDGTKSGTMLVKDIDISDDGHPNELTNVNGLLFFQADDG